MLHYAKDDPAEVMEVDEPLREFLEPQLEVGPAASSSGRDEVLPVMKGTKRRREDEAQEADSESEKEHSLTHPMHKKLKTTINLDSSEFATFEKISSCDRTDENGVKADASLSLEPDTVARENRLSWLRAFVPQVITSPTAHPRKQAFVGGIRAIYAHRAPSESRISSQQHATARPNRPRPVRQTRSRAPTNAGQSCFSAMSLRNPDSAELRLAQLSGAPRALRRWPSMYVDRWSGCFLHSGEFAYL